MQTKKQQVTVKKSPFTIKFRKVWSSDPEGREKGMGIEPIWSAAILQRMYERVLKERVGSTPDYEMTNLEAIIRRHVQIAVEGNDQVAQEIFCRIWGTDYEYLDASFTEGLDENSNFCALGRRIEEAVKAKEHVERSKALQNS